MSKFPVSGRQHARADVDVFVNKIVGDEPHLSRVRDISSSGVYLYRLLEPETQAEQVGLEIMLPDGQDVIWAVGKVVRQDRKNTDGVAVRFTRIAAADKARIETFVQSQGWDTPHAA